jgi:hypothetical protein
MSLNSQSEICFYSSTGYGFDGSIYNITCPVQEDYINYGPAHVLRCDVKLNTTYCECQPYIYCQSSTSNI